MIRPIFLRGEAAFQAEGEDYLIVLDVTGWLAAERAAGVSLVPMMARIHNAIEIGSEPLTGDLAAILFGGLQRNHPELTIEDAVNLLMGNYQAVTAALNEAIVGSLPQAEGEAGNVEAPAASGNGTGSSRSGAARGKGSKISGGKHRA